MKKSSKKNTFLPPKKSLKKPTLLWKKYEKIIQEKYISPPKKSLKKPTLLWKKYEKIIQEKYISPPQKKPQETNAPSPRRHLHSTTALLSVLKRVPQSWPLAAQLLRRLGDERIALDGGGGFFSERKGKEVEKARLSNLESWSVLFKMFFCR